jgi:alpha-glucuronidase
MPVLLRIIFIIPLICFVTVAPGDAQTAAYPAWLRYSALRDAAPSLPTSIAIVGNGELLRTAGGELAKALAGGPKAQGTTSSLPPKNAFVLGRWSAVHPLFPELRLSRALSAEGFWLKTVQRNGAKYWLIIGGSDRGVLYGTFALLSQIAQQKKVDALDDLQNPSAPIRWVSQWDNLDGSIERGYAGRSIFFENVEVRSDLSRASDYARLLASIGVNACVVNNVNADPRLLRPDYLPQLERVAEVFRHWGVRLAISVDLSSPIATGRLKTFDPLDPGVANWWRQTADRIYQQIPDFAGFVIKADSEGRSGPSQYRRTAVDAANVIARALKPHHGVVMYRAFVYNHHIDWKDPKADRARAAYDYFHPLDGKFEDNVVLQIKYGPIDFQVREPASPLFGAMNQTSEAIELQVTQEYTGQQRHLVFLAPMWKETLDFDLHVNGVTQVRDIVSGKVSSFEFPVSLRSTTRNSKSETRKSLGGYNAVVNVGLDPYWLGHPLAIANLYAFGRLAWNPNLSSQQLAEEWTRLTFGNDPRIVATIPRMLLSSWHIYESYTGPLGMGTLTDILGPHYGPGIESSERNGWGQWHHSDEHGTGMDRTVATGTGYIGQYSPEVQKQYEPLQNCPDNLLLFMHHVPYTYVLHSGKTVIQYFYDSHYAGAEEATTLLNQWKSLHGLIDDARYHEVLKRQTYQAGQAIVWRDAVVDWFHKTSGIADAQGRVGNNRNRIEAEAMQLSGYTPVEVTPWETASGEKAVTCIGAQACSATYKFVRQPGKYRVAVQYFDQDNGASRYELFVNERLLDSWTADDHLPSDKMNGHTSTRHTTSSVELRTGDELRVVGHPDEGEPAPLDYVELIPES